MSLRAERSSHPEIATMASDCSCPAANRPGVEVRNAVGMQVNSARCHIGNSHSQDKPALNNRFLPRFRGLGRSSPVASPNSRPLRSLEKDRSVNARQDRDLTWLQIVRSAAAPRSFLKGRGRSRPLVALFGSSPSWCGRAEVGVGIRARA
jgi:hypothetical protein